MKNHHKIKQYPNFVEKTPHYLDNRRFIVILYVSKPYYSAVNGNNAILRARLMDVVNIL